MSSREDNLPSLELALDLVREQANNQRERVTALDTKANFVLGSASIVTGLSSLQVGVRVGNALLPAHSVIAKKSDNDIRRQTVMDWARKILCSWVPN